MRLATFNCENLFARYKFRQNIDPTKSDGFTTNELAFGVFDENEKKITAQAINEVNADVIALQEIESFSVLDHFTSAYLKKMDYKHSILIASHDPRHINVAVLSRYPITSVRTHRDEKNASKKKWLFSRDCLETEVEVDGKNLILYVNHFKSMLMGREKSKDRRMEQVQRVVEIVESKWKEKDFTGNFAVLGDFNDYPGEGTSLEPLLQHYGLENVVERLPPEEQWTHFYTKGKEYRQLDYILLSKSLAQLNTGTPVIMRKGMPKRAEKYTGPRFNEVGEDRPKASDHAPLFMDLNLE